MIRWKKPRDEADRGRDRSRIWGSELGTIKEGASTIPISQDSNFELGVVSPSFGISVGR